MSDDPDIRTVIAAERRLLDPAVRTDRTAVDELLHPAFTEIGASGRLWSRKEILDEMPDWQHSIDLLATDIEACRLGDDLIGLRYVCVAPHGRSRRSSLWHRDATGWRIRFHQGTRVHDAAD